MCTILQSMLAAIPSAMCFNAYYMQHNEARDIDNTLHWHGYNG